MNKLLKAQKLQLFDFVEAGSGRRVSVAARTEKEAAEALCQSTGMWVLYGAPPRRRRSGCRVCE